MFYLLYQNKITMAKFKNTWRIETTRLQNWDYGWNGHYFITICTSERECFFGSIENHTMHLSETGIMAQHFWNKIPEHFPFVLLDAFVVMPNHVHGIVTINKQDGVGNGNNGGNANGNVETRQCLVSTAKSAQTTPSSPGQRRFQNQGKNTVSSII